jgi:hypothetical protein
MSIMHDRMEHEPNDSTYAFGMEGELEDTIGMNALTEVHIMGIWNRDLFLLLRE